MPKDCKYCGGHDCPECDGMPKDYQEVERIVEEFRVEFCEYLTYRNNQIPCWKGTKKENINLIPTSNTVEDWLRTTLTTYGNARELQGVEKVEIWVKNHYNQNTGEIDSTELLHYIATIKK